MAENTARKYDWSLLAIGAVFAGSGLYFILCGADLAPMPSHLNGPDWLASAVGLVFLATGLSVSVRGWLAVPDNQSNLPADAPVALVATQWLAAFTIVAGLASIGTWIAFGAGTRHFSMSLPLTGSTGEMIGRIAFGFGAIVTWLMAAGVAYAGINKIIGRKR